MKYLDNIKTHVDDMLGASAVVSGSGVALQGIAEVSAVKVMISQIIMTPPETHTHRPERHRSFHGSIYKKTKTKKPHTFL